MHVYVQAILLKLNATRPIGQNAGSGSIVVCYHLLFLLLWLFVSITYAHLKALESFLKNAIHKLFGRQTSVTPAPASSWW